MASFATPSYSCMTAEDKANVYEPAEDSMLLIDALEKDFNFLRNNSPLVAVEVGCGSGVVSAFVAKILQNSCFHLCTDVNFRAADVAQRVGLQNGVALNVVVTDLASAFGSRLHGLVDLLLFNPPYVVTPSEEVASGGIVASWAGGHNGREVMDRLFPLVHQLLSKKGVFYLVVVNENNIVDIERVMKQYGLRMETVLSRRSGPEHLHVLKFSHALALH